MQARNQVDIGIGIVVTGTILDNEQQPVPDAQVAFADRPVVVTGEDGRFAVGGLAAGDHKVTVSAPGFKPFSRTVAVVDGTNAPVEFVLDRVATQRPYTELAILRGYSICDVSLFLELITVDSLTGTCPLGTPNRFVKVRVNETWRYAIVEMQWQALESFALYTSKDQNCLTGAPCWGAVMGRSPLRLEGAPGDEALAKRYAPYGPPVYTGKPVPYPNNGTFDLFVNTLYAGAAQQQINGTFGSVCLQDAGVLFGCPGVGANVAGIPFTVYASIFHYERPRDPGKYSAIQ